MALFSGKSKSNQRVRRSRNGYEREYSEEEYEIHIQRVRRRRTLRLALIFIVLIIAALLFLLFNEKRSYHGYKIIASSEQEDIVSTTYMEMDGNILRYNSDGVSLVTKDLETVWSDTYSMQNPVGDVRGKHAVIADVDGMNISIYDSNGLTGTVTTSYSIVKAKVSDDGLVAAILDSGDTTYINFYSAGGELLAETLTEIDDPGYPMDVAISNNGILLMVTFQYVNGGETTSYVAFYNFGDVGQNEDDRIVSGYRYEGCVIPEVHYLDGASCAAIRDDGFTIYSGKQIPEEKTTVKVDEEIVSVFHDDQTIGLVFRNEGSGKLYTMKVYDDTGNKKFEKEFNVPYSQIKVSEDYIIMYNSSQFCIMNGNGVTKYEGTVDGSIHDLIKVGMNRYLLVLETGINIIKLS